MPRQPQGCPPGDCAVHPEDQGRKRISHQGWRGLGNGDWDVFRDLAIDGLQ